jgi:hypothetical protein
MRYEKGTMLASRFERVTEPRSGTFSGLAGFRTCTVSRAVVT